MTTRETDHDGAEHGPDAFFRHRVGDQGPVRPVVREAPSLCDKLAVLTDRSSRVRCRRNLAGFGQPPSELRGRDNGQSEHLRPHVRNSRDLPYDSASIKSTTAPAMKRRPRNSGICRFLYFAPTTATTGLDTINPPAYAETSQPVLPPMSPYPRAWRRKGMTGTAREYDERSTRTGNALTSQLSVADSDHAEQGGEKCSPPKPTASPMNQVELRIRNNTGARRYLLFGPSSLKSSSGVLDAPNSARTRSSIPHF